MQKIIEYFNSNPKYTITLIGTFIICFIIIALIVVFYKKSKTIKVNELQKNEENDQSCLAFDNFVDITQPEAHPDMENNSSSDSNPADSQDESVIVFDDNQANNKENSPSAEESQKEYKEETKEEAQEEKQEEKQAPNQENEADEEKQESASTRYNGKWIIYLAENRYFADLKASNGELMLRTESYASLSGVKSGIETLKKNIEAENYAVSLDKNGNFVFKIFSTSKRLLCVGEGYSSREQCEKAFNSVKRFSKTAKIIVYRENDSE